jgi:hypothetical protein
MKFSGTWGGRSGRRFVLYIKLRSHHHSVASASLSLVVNQGVSGQAKTNCKSKNVGKHFWQISRCLETSIRASPAIPSPRTTRRQGTTSTCHPASHPAACAASANPSTGPSPTSASRYVLCDAFDARFCADRRRDFEWRDLSLAGDDRLPSSRHVTTHSLQSIYRG